MQKTSLDRTQAPRRKNSLLRGGMYLVILGFLLAFATFTGWLGRSETVRSVIGGMLGEKPQHVFSAEGINLLILGCDEIRKPGGIVVSRTGRSDMMLLVHMDFKQKKVSALSIPRDIRCRVSDFDVKLPSNIDYLKINGFHAHGGPEMTQKVVQELLKVKVDRTLVVDYVAFRELIDQIGGVDMFVERAMKYDDNAGDLHIDLAKGRHKLNGDQAIGFVRFRKAAGESDFTRQKRQKDLLLAIKDQILSRPTVIPSVADKAVAVLGNGLSGKELGSVIWFARGVKTENIKMGSVPVKEHYTRHLYYQEVKTRELPALLKEYGMVSSGDAPGARG